MVNFQPFSKLIIFKCSQASGLFSQDMCDPLGLFDVTKTNIYIYLRANLLYHMGILSLINSALNGNNIVLNFFFQKVSCSRVRNALLFFLFCLLKHILAAGLNELTFNS